MKQKINLLIHPTYDYKVNLDLTKLMDMLDEISSKYDVTNIEISGSEVSLLSDFYLEFLCKLVQSYSYNVNIITDLQQTRPAIINNFNNISVKVNFLDFSRKVKDNIKAVAATKNITILSYDLHCLNNQKQNIFELNNLKVKSWKIIPYIVNNINKGSQSSAYEDYEQTIKEYLNLTSYMKFAFINKLEIDNIINNDNYNTINVVITPENKYALITYTKLNKEIYEVYDTLDELNKGINDYTNKIEIMCKDCAFKNHCLSNNFNFNYIGNTCSGFRNLLQKSSKK